MRKKIPQRNRSPHGWWVATYIMRLDEGQSHLTQRCLAWENTILIQALDRNQAYTKALKMGKASAKSGNWLFEGLTEILPIYEKLEDGAEIIWTEHRSVTLKKIRSRLRKKNDMPVFDDSEPA